jgi:anti-anti-sigma factor
MKIDQVQQGSVLVLIPHGPMIEPELPVLNERLQADDVGLRLVLNIREVPYLDSAGLELLADLAKRFMATGQRLKLAEANELCHETLDVTRLIRHFELIETTEDAIRSFL